MIFFGSFAPQNFYRVYKPGVDTVRFERQLANLSQLTLAGVLGYDRDPESDSGWSRSPDWDRTSVLGRYVMDAGGFEWGALGVLSGTARLPEPPCRGNCSIGSGCAARATISTAGRTTGQAD
jgi:hypothetical protein